MAMKPNYNFEKRQRELAKKKKQDEKLAKKRAKNAPADTDMHEPSGTATNPTTTGTAS
ncbi:MAG: hypothetical protein ACREO6_00665 [Rudaea sp.]